MGEALVTLLTISAGGTLLALLLFALGKLLGRRLPRAAYYYLWLLVLLRLLLPWGSRLSLLDGEAEPPRAAVLSDAPAEGLWLPEGVDAPAAGSVAPDVGAADGAQDGAEPGEGKGPAWDTVLAAVWLGGAAASIAWFSWAYCRYARRLLRGSQPAGEAELALLGRLAEGRKAALLYSAQAETPMLLGLLRPRIILPAGTGAERLEHILRHELTHLARRDLGYKWLAVFVTSLHWFNPFMPLIRREIGAACELACDEAAVGRLDARGRQAYGETLIAMSARRRMPAGALSTTLGEGKRLLRGRLQGIMKYRRPGAAATALSAALALALTACAAALGPQADRPAAGKPAESAPPSEIILAESSGDGTELEFAIPGEYAGELLLERGGGGGTLLSVYEKYSFDNAAAAGLEGGLICSVLRYSRWELEQLLTGDMGGCAVFARDEDELGERYYLLYTPTDAQFFPAGGGVADTESDEFARWTELNRTVPALVADGITGANGLTPCTTGELTADYTYESGEHIQIRYSYIEDEAYDDVVLILSQPSRQGEGGIWCVERYIDAERNVYLCFPGAVGEEARDYYDRAQRRVDAGEEQWRLEPLEVARDFVENSGEWPEPPLDSGSYEIVD